MVVVTISQVCNSERSYRRRLFIAIYNKNLVGGAFRIVYFVTSWLGDAPA